MHSHHCGHERGRGWDRAGRSAERFARRMADDARRFAERVEENVAELTRDMKREFSRGAPSPAAGAEDDLQRIFAGVRRVLRTVLDGVDEMLAGGAPPPPAPDGGTAASGGSAHPGAGAGAGTAEPGPGAWTRVVFNHDAPCAACGRVTAAGTEGWARRTEAGPAFRCLECGSDPA